MAHGRGALRGLRVTMGVMLTRPFTVEYPFKRLKFAPVYRGGFCFYPDKCIACQLCQSACPNGVITVGRERGPDKKMHLVSYEMDLQYCLYCGFCVEACNKDALVMTDQIDLTTYDRSFLKVAVPKELIPRPASAPSTAGPAKKAETAPKETAPRKEDQE
ncbi:MAG: 4Fe-4S dicluster domain-containing protein [Bacillota bacterium]